MSADAFLARLRRDGGTVSLDGSRLAITGVALSDADRDFVRANAVALRDALRNERTPVQPPTEPPKPVAPPAPDEPPILWRGKRLADADLRLCLENFGEFEAYQRGEISRRDAERMTVNWLRKQHELADSLINGTVKFLLGG